MEKKIVSMPKNKHELKGFIHYKRKPSDFFYPTLKQAKEQSQDEESVAEVEIKIIRIFKQKKWFEVK